MIIFFTLRWKDDGWGSWSGVCCWFGGSLSLYSILTVFGRCVEGLDSAYELDRNMNMSLNDLTQ